jgi:hypothetical protein
MAELLGICFLGGVLEGVAEEIGEGRKGVGYQINLGFRVVLAQKL